MTTLFALSLFLFAAALFGASADVIQSLMTWWYTRKSPALDSKLPGISILKPLCGIDDDLEKNLEHFASLDYPNYEVLLGVKNEKDTAYPVAVAATRKYPARFKLFLQRGEPGLNPKVNQLVTLQAQAKHEIVLVSDSNCQTVPGYLREIAALFEDPKVACVTNPIVGVGERKLGSLLDNFHLGATIGPGMIAAKLAPIPHDIVVGKSMALRKSALEAAGGFYAARNHLAEDYVLGQAFHEMGFTVGLCRLPVLQVSQDKTLKDFLNRQKRWQVIHRTSIRLYTYFGEGVMNATPFALLGMLLHPSRSTMTAFVSLWLFKSLLDTANARRFRPELFGWRTPFYVLLKDLCMGYAWAYGLVVRTVNWRGNALRVGHGSLLTAPDLNTLPMPMPQAIPAMEPAHDRRNVA